MNYLLLTITKSKILQVFNIQTKRLVSFEGLNSSLAQSPDKLWSCKVAWKMWLMRDFDMQIYDTLAPKVLIISVEWHP